MQQLNLTSRDQMEAGEKETISIQLRDVTESDLPIFFEYQRDQDPNHVATFTAKDVANSNKAEEMTGSIVDL